MGLDAALIPYARVDCYFEFFQSDIDIDLKNVIDDHVPAEALTRCV
jgi:hypothetical protein